jgi:class 3 adenylate cyclase
VKIEDLPSRYDILETIRGDSRRALLRAYDTQLDRAMALKVIALDGSVSRSEYVEEARMLMTLDSHPNLPTMRGDFFLDDAYVIVMDWIDGNDLATVVEERGTPGLKYQTVVEYVGQAAAALDHLHGNDPPIVHGDVKPANLVVTNTGKVVLVDLGLARETGSRREAGTRGFFAPEVSAGEPSTPATDVYGLAATAVALLTGRPPGYGVPDFSDVDPLEAAPLRRALAVALASDPAQRPRSAGDFAERIRAGNRALPSGVVTFLALEIVDADELWDRDPDGMQTVCERFDDLVAAVVESHNGRLLTAEAGDRLRAVFGGVSTALAAALAVQRGVRSEPWPYGIGVTVRGALHTGESEARDGAYVGPVPVRAGRLRNHAPPDRVVVSTTTAELVRRQLPEGVLLVELLRDGTGDMVFGLLAPGDEPFEPFESFEPVAASVPSQPPRSPAPAAMPVAPGPLREQHARIENAVRNALELAEQARRSGNEAGAARFDATAQELAERLVAVEREMPQ